MTWTASDMAEMRNRVKAKDAKIERLRVALKIADESIRHHLRSDRITAALIQPHAVEAIRKALNDEQEVEK